MERWLRVLSWVAAVLYISVGVGELIFAGESFGHRAVFAAVMCAFAVLVVVGVRLIDVRPWVGAALASVGAIGGGISIFWTVATPVLAIAIVVLSIAAARRSRRPALSSA